MPKPTVGRSAEIKLGGWPAMVLIGAFVVFTAWRIVASQNIRDPQLEQVIHQRFDPPLQAKYFEKVRDGSQAVESALPTITILSLSKSSPVFSWSSNEEFVLRVRYKEGSDKAEKLVYLRFKNRLIGRPEYMHEATSLGFMLRYFGS